MQKETLERHLAAKQRRSSSWRGQRERAGGCSSDSQLTGRHQQRRRKQTGRRDVKINTPNAKEHSSGTWLLSRGDQVVGGGNGSGQAGAAATPNSRDGTNKDGENKQDDAT